MPAGNRFRFFITVVVASAALEIGKNQASAQIGFGFEIFRPVPSPTQFVNDHALVRAGAGRKEPSRNVYANNSNSFVNRIRDNGFSSHYSARSHRSPGYEVERKAAPSRSQVSSQPAPETNVRPTYPISSFFNAARQIVWPNESPATEELKPKRDISDQASLTVLELVEKHRSAPITTVTDARQKLLDYGQPALRVARSASTPRLADSFHMFLLSLYDSLGAAANPTDGG
jgi:hypothetical protein